MDEKLIRFVDHAREQRMDYATIRQLLVSAGWKDADVAEVFCARDLELPIPTRLRAVRFAPRAGRDQSGHVGLGMPFFTC